MLARSHITLAEFSPSDLVDAIPALVAIISILGFVALVLQVWIQCRKLFAKQPPMHEQIAKLRDELIQSAAAHEADDAKEISRLESRIDAVDRDVRQFRAEVNTNGEIRKQVMLNHIEDVRTKLDQKIDIQTAHLNNKIDESSREQTKQLIAVLKGKDD